MFSLLVSLAFIVIVGFRLYVGFRLALGLGLMMLLLRVCWVWVYALVWDRLRVSIWLVEFGLC